MGYDLHITRAEDWLDAEARPIGRDEWNSYAGRHPDMVAEGWVEWADVGREPIYDWPSGNEERSSLSWRNGEVVVTGVYTDHLPGLVTIAADLGANLIGDDGERYSTEGTID
ncbi:hypothetical protein KZZ52_33900 [Dactylosporangium sp. AC04546]|uniref:hypothetical protein n=1 Tax=Dactylosporangium sp. AC04546 TaxID=2862460 RepID=UPI001EE06AAB|nr:hypothetical protein [Dactylosporangium sp. AC04546]WVK78967.1 hypothetical protein KZZ52_33900 [Dactylosporangium sp. AC04546]